MTTVPGTDEHHGVADIKRIVSAKFNEYLDADNKRAMARNDANAASEASIGKRGALMTYLADTATRHSWSVDDVKEAVTEIVNAYAGNDKKKASSVATFKSEVLVACDRKVRPYVGDIFKLANEAVARETAAKAADKEAPTPIKKTFARAHHAAVAALKAVSDRKNFKITTIEDLTQFAIATTRARQIDYGRVKKRLEAIRAELGQFYDDFPVDGIQVCLDYLKDITADELKEALREATSADAEQDAAPEPAEDNEPEIEPEDDDKPEPEVAQAPKTIGDYHDAALRDIMGEAA